MPEIMKQNDIFIKGVDITALEKSCNESFVSPGHGVLVDRINHATKKLNFENVLTRSSWYREGGIVDEMGTYITRNIRLWVERESEGDISRLMDKYADTDWYVTRLTGKTHYFVAPTGSKADDFVQLEVEEIQEVKFRPLFDNECLDDDLENFIDPVYYSVIEEENIGKACYQFRRITNISDMVDDLLDFEKTNIPVKRLLSDWDKSSAGQSSPFYQYWIMSLRPYIDRYGEQKFSIRPYPVFSDVIPEIGDDQIERGANLANLIHSFDRKLGYPMAWYFFMLSNRKVSQRMAEAIHLDLMGAYDYLPPRDVKVLYSWINNPYTV